MDFGSIKLEWLGHSGFRIKNEKIVYIDPFKLGNISENEKADIILITHSHHDHCSLEDINKIVKDGTVFIIPPDAQSKITRIDKKIEMKLVIPGDSVDLDFKIDVHPAYNTNKNFHPKNEEWLSYVVKIGSFTIYHAGDTDIIPEMSKLTGYGRKDHNFVALFPVSGKFTMDAKEAAEAASIIKPGFAIPMHYGSIIGSQDDANEFVKLCSEKGINAVILDKVG